MKNLKYRCMKCGVCCYEVPGDYSKRIPLYPDEADLLIEEAKERNIHFKIMEDLVFPDILNKKILVLTYKIRLDNENECCPFYNKKIGCVIQDIKPLACKAYPLAIKQEDAFHFMISIDPLCNFVDQNYELLSNIDMQRIKEIFCQEYKNALIHLNKNKNLILKIKRLEYLNKIKISRKISLNDFNNYLKEWERVEIKT
ncbi:MAG: hypothetical protein GF317_17820 [Candidatus Lokiarchaeota archaeon]|nr:hypothetical protein [Candidatus Lokiarchaeota archaeon]MBD3201371.1 hypothetical protein [Candidatus Lokiarchaeota archaeon]